MASNFWNFFNAIFGGSPETFWTHCVEALRKVKHKDRENKIVMDA